MNDELMELPEGWEWATTSDVCSSVRDGTHDSPKYVENGVPLITSKNLKNGQIDFSTAKLISHEDHRQISIRSGVEKGDVLFAMIGTIGNPVVIDAEQDFSIKNVGLFKKNDAVIEPHYLNFWLSSDVFWKIIEYQDLIKGTTQKFLPLGTLRTLLLPLPPLNEQKRIVAQIEALRERSQKAKAALEAIPELCDRFRQSVLAAAFRGDLTADWREENPDVEPASVLLERIIQSHRLAGGHKKGNAAPPTDGVHTLVQDDFPEIWEIIELKDACKPNRPITYGILKPGPELEKGVPYIRVADFPNDQLNLSTIRKTSFEIDQQFSRSRLEENDILLSIRGTVGRICKIPRQLVGANITQDSARLSVQEFINIDYICLMLKEKSMQQRMEKATKGVAVRGINIGDVRALQIPLPPYSEQLEIVQRVKVLLQVITLIEQQHQFTQTQLDRLNQSILAKAFRGELVDQDPNDEPASVLLERIQSEREAQQPAKQKQRKGSNRSKSTESGQINLSLE